MPAFSEEKWELLKREYRAFTVRNARAGVRDIGEALKIDPATVIKLRKEIYKEQIENLDISRLKEYIVDLQITFAEETDKLWAIVEDSGTSVRDRIYALTKIANFKSEIFDKLFDAGIFTRQLGALDLGERREVNLAELLGVILDAVDVKTRELIIGLVTEHLKRSGGGTEATVGEKPPALQS